MKKIIDFLDKHSLMIILVLIVLNTCTNSMSKKMSEKKMLKQVEGVQKSLDSLKQTLQKEIKIEGLKGEQRMIQATDRKMLDVQRQNVIEKEIEKLKASDK